MTVMRTPVPKTLLLLLLLYGLQALFTLSTMPNFSRTTQTCPLHGLVQTYISLGWR